MSTDFPPALVDLQRHVHTAWEQVEAHRREVDAARHAQAQPEPGRPAWVSPTLRPWTPEEDTRHSELLTAARDAAEQLRRALVDSGLGTAYDVIQGLHKAARAG